MRYRSLTTLAIALCTTLANAQPTPNILMITIEDWSASAIGCYGNKEVITPNVDRLASTGIRFDRAYCQATVCNPSRASFVTGLRPDSSRIFTNGDSMDELVPANAPSLAATLSEKDAYLAQMGKLVHIWEEAGRFAKGFDLIEYTHHYDRPPNFSGTLRPVPHGPVDTGDDVEMEAFLLPDKKTANRLKKLHAEREAAIAAGKPNTWEIRKPFQQLYAEQVGDSGLDEASMEDGRIARSAAKLLEDLAEKKQPFFLNVGFYATHTPLLAPKKYVDLYDPAKLTLTSATHDKDQGVPQVARRNGQNYDIFNGLYPEFGPTPKRQRAALAAYYACASYIDAQVGVVLEALEKNGLADDTIVVLFSDHGFQLGEHGLWSKFTLFEQSTRVPLIIRQPGAAANGKTTDSIVELIDIFPTLCDFWSLEKPEALEGRSLMPLLDDPSKDFKQAAYSVITLGGLGRSLRTDRYRYAEYFKTTDFPDETTNSQAVELYDLENDPLEQRNLATSPEHAALVRKFRPQLRTKP